MNARLFWVTAGLLAMCTAASSQQTGEAPPVLSVKTDLVTLSVTVVDRDGRFVGGLGESDFTVFDNGQPQSIRFFSAEEVPATIGLVIDSSGSMRGRRSEVTASAAAFAAMSHPLDELFTVNFNEWVWPGLPPSLPFTADREQLRIALAAAPAAGMSALYDAVDRALTHLQRGTRDRKALVVVSDGGDNASVQSLDAVVEHARRSAAAIYTVTLYDPDNREGNPRVLKTLARETGGHAFTAKRTEDVTRTFTQIARELRSGYTIAFLPPETSGGAFRSIYVDVNSPGSRQFIVRTRAGYYAAP